MGSKPCVAHTPDTPHISASKSVPRANKSLIVRYEPSSRCPSYLIESRKIPTTIALMTTTQYKNSIVSVYYTLPSGASLRPIRGKCNKNIFSLLKKVSFIDIIIKLRGAYNHLNKKWVAQHLLSNPYRDILSFSPLQISGRRLKR